MGLLDGTMDSKPEVTPENKDLFDMSPQERYAETERCIAETNVLFQRRRDAEEIQRWHERNFPPSPEAVKGVLQFLIDLPQKWADWSKKVDL